ncbi:acetate--CoA ligase family protein [Candidatus Lokiarchaeum ossiferum]|uniref:acetate--CoA ligase family protein n=1 Tax=Candidatus Lokiarchaeum ossiferum TaxID=2951803 RepID=UPI00352ED162
MVDQKANPHFLNSFINPASIAFFGANEQIPDNMGALQALTLIDNGYLGQIYPIHPRLDTVFGYKAYKSIKDIPNKVDLAKLILPKRYVPQILEECGQCGVKHIIIVTAGYREVNDKDSQDEIMAIINKYDLKVLGPNCIGMLNTHGSLLDSSAEFVINTTVQMYNEPPGTVSIASQSGTFVSHSFMLLAERDLHLSRGFSLGNELIIDLCDCLEFFEQDQQTEVILLYIEEIKRGRRFYELAKRISSKKPIVVLYPGGTSGGSKAISSHTGSMAGNDEIHNAVFNQSGIIRADSVEELFDIASILAKLIPTDSIPKGDRIAIMTNSGGPGAMMADATSRAKLTLPPLGEKLKLKLGKLLPPTAQATNPLDLTFSLNPAQFHYTIPRMYAKSSDFDVLICYGAFGPSFFRFNEFGTSFMNQEKSKEKLSQWLELVESSIESAKRIVAKFKFPIINVIFMGLDEPVFSLLNKSDFPTFKMPHQAIAAIKKVIGYGKYRHKILNLQNLTKKEIKTD